MNIEKKKILYIVEAMGGGIFTHIVTLANGLCDEFDITLAYGIRNETPKELRKLFDERVHLIQVKNFTRKVEVVRDNKAALELKGIIKKVDPDIIHLHSSKAGALGRLRFSKKKYKLLYTPHGYSFLMENTTDARRKIYKKIEKHFGKKDCLTVACGSGEWIVSREVTNNSTYINNGIDTKKIDELLKNESSEHKEFTVCTLGRIDYQKNPARFNEIAKSIPDTKFVWVGDGDLRDELTSPNIEITGWISREESLEILNKSDVFVLTSRWEGLPMSLLEAMYLKKVCIVSDVVGNIEMIDDSVTGYICKTVEWFVKRINEVKEVHNHEMGESAHDTIVKGYTTASFCQRYRELYRKCIEKESTLLEVISEGE